MKKIKVSSFTEFIENLGLLEMLGYDINIFRGQSTHHALLPNICRDNPSIDTVNTERKMLEDFKRRSEPLMTKEFKTDWEWLVYAQHFGLKTRLLDWTSNPLIALWFACENTYKINNDGYVYIFSCEDKMRVDLNKNTSPFEIRSTKVLKPMLNNDRIIAQYGWFTAHAYSKTSARFVRLETNSSVKRHLIEIRIPATLKKDIVRKLSLFGVNSGTVFPDVGGLSQYLNWEYLADKF